MKRRFISMVAIAATLISGNDVKAEVSLITGQPGVSDSVITALKSSILSNSQPDRNAPGLNFRLDAVPILGLAE
ncbi:hypothetical protein Lepto7375DRAFT_8040 [Leptolyngbya sp. PCC 7375]|nr:hypothetical protein Lepto7375DRAFT_8040 [Leptolyngbya sp. PCC 7375]